MKAVLYIYIYINLYLLVKKVHYTMNNRFYCNLFKAERGISAVFAAARHRAAVPGIPLQIPVPVFRITFNAFAKLNA